MKTIALTQGKFAIVDAEDYDELSKHKWYATKTRDGDYVALRGRNPAIYMHRVITNCPKGMEVDHHNHNQLDNHKSNLRICTRLQNKQNGLKRKNCSSIYKGVSWHKREKKWCAQIGINYKQIYLGYFDSEAEAAKAYDATAKRYFGEFAKLNF